MTDVEHHEQPASDERRATEVFYDGACPVCRREIDVYKRMIPDRAVAWCDVSQAGDQVAEDLSGEDAIRRFHVRRADGTLVAGARAFLAVWRNMPRLRWLAILLDRQPFVWLGDAAYWGFLRIRPMWRRQA